MPGNNSAQKRVLLKVGTESSFSIGNCYILCAGCSARVGSTHAEQKQEQRHPTDHRGYRDNDHPDRPGTHDSGHETLISSAREWQEESRGSSRIVLTILPSP
jgi:hypothetical protein